MTGNSALAIRIDGNSRIGSGHIMRCCAVAHAAEALGCEAVFFVSDEESAKMVQAQGYTPGVLGGDYHRLTEDDAGALACSADGVGAMGVLVDSYAATDGFLARLKFDCKRLGIRLGYIDDEYRFAGGFSPEPVKLPVDVLVNYGFGASREAYETVYAGTGAELLIGPRFAPVREEFLHARYEVAETVSSILVTTGSTNPNNTLERFAACAFDASHTAIHVVVGANARFEGEETHKGKFIFHHNPRDMRSLMLASDIVVSAGGTTLYELASLGVPAIAVPITENQLANVRGWKALKIGQSIQSVEWDDEELVAMVRDLADDVCKRSALSLKMRAACDGHGAEHVVRSLLK